MLFLFQKQEKVAKIFQAQFGLRLDAINQNNKI